MNHVSVSPTDGNGPTQGQRKTLTRVNPLSCRRKVDITAGVTRFQICDSDVKVKVKVKSATSLEGPPGRRLSPVSVA